jgi:hypothetical protein
VSQTEQRHDRISRGWTLVDLLLTAAAASLFNLFPRWVGVLVSATDPSSFVPLLAPGFASYLPGLNLWWGVTFSLDVAHLALGRWILATRGIDIARRLLGIALLIWMVAGPPLVVGPWASAIVRIILAATGIAMLVSVVLQGVRLLGGE